MAQNYDLNSRISAAQREVDSWERRAALSSVARPVGSKWPLTVVMWLALALALYAERHTIEGWITPHDSTATVEQLSEIIRHTADDIETYRDQFGELPDSLPIDFLNGVLSYSRDGAGYVLETTYHDSLVRLQADASGPGPVKVVPR